MDAILDFGCGCGRLARWWTDVERPSLFGCDPNPELVRWCRDNLSHLNAAVSDDRPPLPYPDASFDFIYAFSIFTHLPDKSCHSWMAELRRVVKPGGLLLFTVAGETYRDVLTAPEAERYARGESVVQFGSSAGTNLCIAYHPPSFVRARLIEGEGFDLLEAHLSPEHPEDTKRAQLPQDTYLVRRRGPVE